MTKDTIATPSPEELQEQVKTLVEKVASLESENKALTENVDSLVADKNDLTEINAALQKEIEQFSAKAPEMFKSAEPQPGDWKILRFENGDAKFKFTSASTIWEGAVITAQEMVNNEELQAKFLEIGAEFFIPE